MSIILLVEDDEANRDVLSRRLARRGYQVIPASNGAVGIELARQDQPDVILLDMRMPVLDGWQVAHRLRQDPVTQHIPIIALTAHAVAGDREKTLAAGCDDYESKPVNFPSLLAKIEVLLDKGRGASPTEGA